MSKRVAVVQSSYIPWKGYFDLMNRVDELILFDDVQYTRRDWRNRNRIKTPRGPAWLSIPVQAKGNYLTAIKDITLSDPAWGRRHLEVLAVNYRPARHFKTYEELFAELYLCNRDTHLSAVNRRFLAALCGVLGIDTKLTFSMEYSFDRAEPDRTKRLIDLCRRAGATAYLSGPTARNYMDEELFAREGLELSYMDYSGYPEYHQLHPPFEHAVSILDLIFNEGPDAPKYMLSFR